MHHSISSIALVTFWPFLVCLFVYCLFFYPHPLTQNRSPTWPADSSAWHIRLLVFPCVRSSFPHHHANLPSLSPPTPSNRQNSTSSELAQMHPSLWNLPPTLCPTPTFRINSFRVPTANDPSLQHKLNSTALVSLLFPSLPYSSLNLFFCSSLNLKSYEDNVFQASL